MALVGAPTPPVALLLTDREGQRGSIESPEAADDFRGTGDEGAALHQHDAGTEPTNASHFMGTSP